MKLPFVSVVIPAHNEEKFIRITLKELRKQKYPAGFEVIVVDNASRDKTAEIAKKLGAKVIYEARKGVQFARQRGFEEAKGEFIASTDADESILPKDWILKMSRQLSEEKETVAVGGWFKIRNGTLISRFVVNFLTVPAVYLYIKISNKRVLSGANFMVKKRVFEGAGGFVGLSATNEDLELAQRLSRFGNISLHLSDNWNIFTSARRWNEGVISGSIPYILNAISYALTGKLYFKQLSDVREKPGQYFFADAEIAVIGILLFTAAFFLSNPPQVLSNKLYPVKEEFEERVKDIRDVEKSLRYRFGYLQ